MAQLRFLLRCGPYWLRSLRRDLVRCWISLELWRSQSHSIPNTSMAIASADAITTAFPRPSPIPGFASPLSVGIEFSWVWQLLRCADLILLWWKKKEKVIKVLYVSFFPSCLDVAGWVAGDAHAESMGEKAFSHFSANSSLCNLCLSSWQSFDDSPGELMS